MGSRSGSKHPNAASATQKSARGRTRKELDRARDDTLRAADRALRKALRSPAVRREVQRYLLGRCARPGPALRRLAKATVPLGIPATDWQRILCCLLYTLYHRFKHTRLAGKLFFDVDDPPTPPEGTPPPPPDYKPGKPFRTTKKNVKKRGRVVHVEGFVDDCDFCFDIVDADGRRWHCEITPCDQDRLRDFIRELQRQEEDIKAGRGPDVEVAGDEAYDPPHREPLDPGKVNPGVWEVHPVTGAWFII